MTERCFSTHGTGWNEYKYYWAINRSQHWTDFNKRDAAIADWGFAIPNDEAIDAIAKHGPVLEVMAGSGYWSRLLSEHPSTPDVIAVDDFSWDGDTKIAYGKYYDVLKGDAVEFASMERGRTLLMVWPPMEDVSERVIRSYCGNVICIVCEDHGGCCGTDGMYDALYESFELTEEIQIPCWNGVHDSLKIWTRK
jgi:hypothetical protein